MVNTIDKVTFEKLSRNFISISNSLDDDWQIRTCKVGEDDELYLEKKAIHPVEENKQNCDNVCSTENNFFTFIYHVIYSTSYSVPVLYFNAYYCDGKPLNLDEILDQVPKCYKENIIDNKWTTITQLEHPKFGYPCFSLHPCQTAHLMLNVCKKTTNYIITWLSIVGPVVGLKLSTEYAKFVTVDL